MPEEHQDSQNHAPPEQFQPQSPDMQPSDDVKSQSDAAHYSVPIEDREPIVPRDEEGNLSYKPLEEGSDRKKAEHAIAAGAASAIAPYNDHAGYQRTYYDDVVAERNLEGKLKDTEQDGERYRLQSRLDITRARLAHRRELSTAFQEGRAQGRLDGLPERINTADRYLSMERHIGHAKMFLRSHKIDVELFGDAVQEKDKDTLREYIRSDRITVRDSEVKEWASWGKPNHLIIWPDMDYLTGGFDLYPIDFSYRDVPEKLSEMGVPAELIARAVEAYHDQEAGNMFYGQIELTQISAEICRDHLVPAFEVELAAAKEELGEAEKLLGLTERKDQ